ncbi:MAG: murein transglycosylase A [Hyphomicrobiaceae bacterium]
MTYEAVAFADLPGWADDDHGAAMGAFRHSLDRLQRAFPGLPAPGDTSPRHYFEAHFEPHRVIADNGTGEHTSSGLFTGYYEPVLRGSRQRSAHFPTPLLRRPDDLVTLCDDSLRASAGAAPTHARRTPAGLEPYPTRQAIEQGCLDGQGLELLYLQCPVDAFFLHVQGSGLIELDDGNPIRVGYAAKNGHPYMSIGKALIADGAITAEDMSLQTLAAWLRSDPDRARRTMWRNPSYIFFKEIGNAASVSATGVDAITLTPGRSLAVDASIHAIGLPVFMTIEDLPGTSAPSRRLMVAQDAGSAIRGSVRADIFYGTGDEAGALAGRTKHTGNMFVLLPCAGRAA